MRTQARVQQLRAAFQIDHSHLEFKRVLDDGAFGVVHLAHWGKGGPLVAVKVLRMSLIAMNESALTEFKGEVEFMRTTVRHPNIVLFHGAGTNPDGAPFLVTEFCSQGSLGHILRDRHYGRLHWNTRLEALIHAARGMCFLHSLTPPRVHRDIKSNNLLVSENFVVKIADFGTARLLKTSNPILPSVCSRVKIMNPTFSQENFSFKKITK
eukprot:m.206110 g.206110  ORF g.206110 m.206110 type:complete len:210 (-) comp26057_c0_seq6:739-1368(-)